MENTPCKLRSPNNCKTNCVGYKRVIKGSYKTYCRSKHVRKLSQKLPKQFNFIPSVRHSSKTIIKKLIMQEIWHQFTTGQLNEELSPLSLKYILEYIKKNKDKIEKIAKEYIKDNPETSNKYLRNSRIHSGILREYIHDNLNVYTLRR